MSSKRHSILPPVSSGPKPPVHFSSSITIADSAVLTGTHPIAIHSESVVHPRARLDSLAGRLTVGRRCVVHERATLGAVGTSGRITEAAVTLGDYVVVEVGAAIEAGETVIGEGTVVGVGARVGAGAVIGKVSTGNHWQCESEMAMLMWRHHSTAHLRRIPRLPPARWCPTLRSSFPTGCGGRTRGAWPS